MLKETKTQTSHHIPSNINSLNGNGQSQPETYNTIVIGGGQAGLAVGYYLTKYNIDHVILDASAKVGDAWRNRWDSLRLFTPAFLDSLPGMPFPAPPFYFPKKDEMAGYLTAYAARFNLPVRSGVRVDKLSKVGDYYQAESVGKKYKAKNLVVAMANYQFPKVPEIANQLDKKITQIHSADYRNPAQLREGNVLLVGAGNSGAEIAMELASRHKVYLSGNDTGHIPFNIHGLAARLFLIKFVLRVIFHRVLTVKTPMGRKLRARLMKHGGPLIRTKPKDLYKAGVVRVPRLAGVKDGMPVLEDQSVLHVSNIIWCTGYHNGFSWIDLPVLDEANSYPKHYRGVVADAPGLFFTGLPFIYSASSTMIHGTGRDARYIAKKIAARQQPKDVLQEITHAEEMKLQPDLI